MAIDPSPCVGASLESDGSASSGTGPLYQVAVFERPAGWEPRSADDAPAQIGELTVRATGSDLFAAVREAVEFNEARKPGDRRWAAVVDAGSRGRATKAGRLFTPIAYKVASVWRPEGWEPNSPLDVPKCLNRAEGEPDADAMPYAQALQTIRGLNQQSMDWAGTLWYVLVAVEREPVSETISYDPAGTETTTRVRRLHVVCPESGGRGDCSHCPAHAFPCAAADEATPTQTVVERQVLGGASPSR